VGDGWWEEGCDSLRIEIKSTASHGAKAFRGSSPLPLKGSGGLYFYLQAAQGYRMTSHPLGRAARADAGAKFEGL